MKKGNPKKLILARETVRALDADQSSLVQGGATAQTGPSVCFSNREDCCMSR